MGIDACLEVSGTFSDAELEYAEDIARKMCRVPSYGYIDYAAVSHSMKGNRLPSMNPRLLLRCTLGDSTEPGVALYTEDRFFDYYDPSGFWPVLADNIALLQHLFPDSTIRYAGDDGRGYEVDQALLEHLWEVWLSTHHYRDAMRSMHGASSGCNHEDITIGKEFVAPIFEPMHNEDEEIRYTAYTAHCRCGLESRQAVETKAEMAQLDAFQPTVNGRAMFGMLVATGPLTFPEMLDAIEATYA